MEDILFTNLFRQQQLVKIFLLVVSTEYNSRDFKIRLSGVYIEDDFRSDLGFIRRTDILKINPSFERTFYPKKGKIQKHALFL